MSSDHDHDKDKTSGHDSHDDHPVATDVIPESSPQDMLLKLVTIVGAILISGSFIWWHGQPLAEGEGHGGAETTQH